MPEISSPPSAVSATLRVASWLTHMGVSTYAFDDTLGLINPPWTVTRLHARVVPKTSETPPAMTGVLQAGGAFQGLNPGQFVMIGVEINGVVPRRAYSPRSIAGRSDRFAITVQRPARGKGSNLGPDQLPPGDNIQIEQAGGRFTPPRQKP